MATDEMMKCPKCGRNNTPETNICVCGFAEGWRRWNQNRFDLALKEGWRVLKCPPTPANPEGVGVLVHPNRDCQHSCCRSYPLRHRHRADNIEEIVILDEDNKPGGANGA